MTTAAFRIVATSIVDKEAVRYWRILWTRNGPAGGIEAVYLDETYRERIAPRLQESWTLEELYSLEEPTSSTS
jgi:hypothetical protein